MSINESRAFQPIGIAVLTVSDTRTPADDTSGDLLVSRIAEAGHRVAGRALVTDDILTIQTKVKNLVVDPNVDAVILTGGTGLTGRDQTPEAVRPLLDKEIDGFSVVMHMVSFGKIGTSTLQSRTLAGVSGGTYVFCLPGSPGACADAWDNILKPQLDARHRPCNFIGIMHRLGERADRAPSSGQRTGHAAQTPTQAMERTP